MDRVIDQFTDKLVNQENNQQMNYLYKNSLVVATDI